MKRLKPFWLFMLFFSGLTGCNGQTTVLNSNTNINVGGGCEGCDIMFLGIPENISAVDTSAGWAEKGQKILITGTVYQIDGRTPAPNVILYYYHTNTAGRYIHNASIERSMPPNKLGQTHGYLRGWVKTDADGKYSIYTIKPGTYPTRDEPAHIHLTVKEPRNINEYYIDEFIFDDDELLTTSKRKKLENRGGSGILRVLYDGDLLIAEHNIVLGLNIPNYPTTAKTTIQSGLQIGEDNPSFIPYHAWGPDKGTRTCPVCKYGRYHGIMYFVGDYPNWEDVKKWLTFLDNESMQRQKYLKAYFIYGNSKNYNKAVRQKELEHLGAELQLKNMALTFVPSMTDTETEVHLNKINAAVDNTFIIFKHQSIVDKFINLKATPENFKLISTTLHNTKGNFFNLEAPTYH